PYLLLSQDLVAKAVTYISSVNRRWHLRNFSAPKALTWCSIRSLIARKRNDTGKLISKRLGRNWSYHHQYTLTPACHISGNASSIRTLLISMLSHKRQLITGMSGPQEKKLRPM